MYCTNFSFNKIQIGFTFLVPAHLGSPGQGAIKRVCVCVCVCVLHALYRTSPLRRSVDEETTCRFDNRKTCSQRARPPDVLSPLRPFRAVVRLCELFIARLCGFSSTIRYDAINRLFT